MKVLADFSEASCANYSPLLCYSSAARLHLDQGKLQACCLVDLEQPIAHLR